MKEHAGDASPDAGGNDTAFDESDTGQPTDNTDENTGVCGMSIEATVTADTFEGSEEIYLIGDEGEGGDLCRVRYTVRSVSAPSVPCDICEWAYTLERTESEIIADIGDRCAGSELKLDAERIEEKTGTRVSWGYAAEATGHAHVLMEWNETENQWTAVAAAAWSESDSTLTVDRRDGYCGY